jgi:catechol 1,2-dioxygenase
MRNLTEENLTEAVLQKINAEDPRAQVVIASLIKHLHAFIRDVEPTEEEWLKGIDFLTRTGQMCDDKRQEFILLSDTLGVSMMVDAINHRVAAGVTETTVTGPFHMEGAPIMENGADIARGPERERGEFTLVRGQVTDSAGNPIEGALLDIWQSDDDGHYDVADENQPEMNLRGIFKTDANGQYWFRTVKPSSYPVPVDGPVGELMRATGRHPMRPAHIHFMIAAPGYKRLITHIFVEGDQYLESDAVFGVKDSLVVNFAKNESPEMASSYGFTGPFYEVEFDFALESA